MNNLKQAISIAQILTKILKDEDIILAITDTEKYVYAGECDELMRLSEDRMHRELEGLYFKLSN